MDYERLARDLRWLIYDAHRLSITASFAPAYADTFKRMDRPEPGDLVAETSTIYRDKEHLKAVGYYVCFAREPVPDWPADAGEPSLEPVHYIQQLDGAEIRWVNARFIAAPDLPRRCPPPARSPDRPTPAAPPPPGASRRR